MTQTLTTQQFTDIGNWMNYRTTYNADGTPRTDTAAGIPVGTAADSSAKALISGTLSTYGLASLADWAWQRWQSGEGIDQIMLELRQTPEYNARFPAMATLSKEGRAITEAQYINYEQSAASIFKAAGLPAGFYDSPDDFAKFLVNNVALPELQQRVQMYQQAAFSQPPEVRQAWKDLYGLSDGDLTAFFIDPTKAEPLITQKFNAATAAGWSSETGFGRLNQSQAEMVGNLGLTDAQLAQQFGTLAAGNEFYSPLVGSGESAIGKDVALGAAFGANAPDQAIIEARKQLRLSAFAGGGQVATNQSGAVGAGAAQ